MPFCSSYCNCVNCWQNYEHLLTACVNCFLTLSLNLLHTENYGSYRTLKMVSSSVLICCCCGSCRSGRRKPKLDLFCGASFLFVIMNLYSVLYYKIILAIAAEGDSKFMLNSYLLVFPILFIDFNTCLVIDCSSI